MAQQNTLDFLIEKQIHGIDLTVQPLRQQIAALRSRKELTSSFRHFPNEVIAEIFRACYSRIMEEASGKDMRDMIQVLRLVCFHWNSLIESTPGYWSYIQIRNELETVGKKEGEEDYGWVYRYGREWRRNWIVYPPLRDWIHLSTTRSRNLSLDLDIQYHPEELEDYLGEKDEIMTDILFPELHRWRSCRLFMPGSVLDKYAKELCRPAPRLEEIIINPDQDHGEDVDVVMIPELFRNHAPRLRHLEIGQVVINWDSSILKNLTTLQIVARDGDKELLEHHYRYLLVSCPELERLELYGEWGDLTEIGTDFRITSQLPKLHTLELTYLHTSTIRSLLRSIRSPVCNSIIVGIREGNPFQGLDGDSVIIPVIQSAEELKISSHEDGIINFKSKNTSFKLKWCLNELLPSVINSLLSSPDLSNVYKLHLDASGLCFDKPGGFTSEQFFRKVPNVEDFYAKDCRDMVLLLSQPQPSTQGTRSFEWLLPKVHSLEVSEYETLIDLLEGRYHINPQPDSLIGCSPCEILKEVRVERNSLGDGKGTKLYGIVGEKVVKLYGINFDEYH